MSESDPPYPTVCHPDVIKRLERIEDKLDRVIERNDTDHRNLFVWCAVLTVAIGGTAAFGHFAGLL